MSADQWLALSVIVVLAVTITVCHIVDRWAEVQQAQVKGLNRLREDLAALPDKDEPA